MTAPTTELAKQYRPVDIEDEVLGRWNAHNAFHADPDAGGQPYSIVIPPPNVTAALHMGHALNNTLQDILIRWHRMRGDNAMWMPGTDHAGIATQTVVEKRVLIEEGKRRTDFERDAFVAKIQSWKDEYEARITDQLVRMGCSCDWDRQRFTMDDICARAVREAFFQLFKDGLIYRGKRLVNWDPVTQTALADDEVEMEEIDGFFWYLRYPLEDGSGHVTVATTRPETMLGDTAVAVNPKDTARAHLIGKHVRLPIVNRIIPIIGDDYVVIPNPDSDDAKAKYASGFLKVTPAHDPNDWEIGLRHNLPVINIMAPDASISDKHGWTDVSDEAKPLVGLAREEARTKIVEWFKQHNLLEDVKPYSHSVGHSYRSHVPVEPYLSDQWYVKVTDDRLAGAALRAMATDQRSASDGCVWKEGDSFTNAPKARGQQSAGFTPAFDGEGTLRFFPARYAKTFQSWHENIRDWCISRQLWWGHRIPVWAYRGERSEGQSVREYISSRNAFRKQLRAWQSAGRLFVMDESMLADDVLNDYVCVRLEGDREVIASLEANGFTQDPDVLDTWFSSGLWPLSTMGWPEDTADLRTWNPTSVLCTAREIITLWVSRMVMFNTYFRGCLPFRDVFIHAMIQDGEGQKMSKSLGNGVDPLDIIHSHGADAMRFTLAELTTQTQDVRMPVDVVCPYSGEVFAPKMVANKAGFRVAAPVQQCPTDAKKKFATGYGVASGEARVSDDLPQARNTSSRFDYGRNFANKLWNATRFALSNLDGNAATEGRGMAGGDRAGNGPARLAGCALADRWILSRTRAIIADTNDALDKYDFHRYAQNLYGFIWNDVCDWYIEAVKPTVRGSASQQRVLATVLDVCLRLLHPAMPFITEKLWEHLNAIAPAESARGVEGLACTSSDLLCKAAWPVAADALHDAQAEQLWERMRDVIAMIREVRAINKVPPREKVDVTIKMPDELGRLLESELPAFSTLANVNLIAAGPDAAKPEHAAVVVRPIAEVYLHQQFDASAERDRLTKRLAEVEKNVAALTGRLNNKGYTDKAPAHLVQETRDKLAEAEAEAGRVREQLAGL